MGADVIWIENPKAPDIARGGGFHQGWSVELNRRNMRSMALDIPSEKGREVFLKMLAATDIFIEASKGGQYDRWGLSDEELCERIRLSSSCTSPALARRAKTPTCPGRPTILSPRRSEG